MMNMVSLSLIAKMDKILKVNVVISTGSGMVSNLFMSACKLWLVLCTAKFHTLHRRFAFTERHIQSWTKLLVEWQPKSACKLESYLVRGVPPWLKPQLWQRLLDIDALRDSSDFDYKHQLGCIREQLVDLGISEYCIDDAVNLLCDIEQQSYCVHYGQVSIEALRYIMLDLDRSYPTHINYMGDTVEAREGRASLFRVLAAYARYNGTVEYCQGMSSIAGMFLMYLREEDAFWCLVSLLERHKYLVGYFDHAMERLQNHAEVLQRLFAQRNPRLCKHLEDLGVTILMYVTPWFMCLFTNLPCWDTVLAIWDLLLLEGHKCIFRVAMAILDVMSCDLLQTSSMCQALPLLLHLPAEKVSYDSLMPVVWSTVVEDWEVSSLLAVIAEEAQSPASPVISQKRTHQPVQQRNGRVVKFPGQRGPQRKRLKLGEGTSATSVFSRLAGMFRSRGSAASPRQTRGGQHSTRAASHARRRSPRKRPSLNPQCESQQAHILTSRKGGLELADGCPQSQPVSRPDGGVFTACSSKAHLHETRVSKMSELIPWQPVKIHNLRSPVLSPSTRSVSSPEFAQVRHTPTRRSPRLLQTPPFQRYAAKDPSTPNRDLCHNLASASSTHTFKTFHTPRPLRRTQMAPAVSSASFRSPEVELQPLQQTQNTRTSDKSFHLC